TPEPEPEEIEVVVEAPEPEPEKIEIIVETPEPEPEEAEIVVVAPEPEQPPEAEVAMVEQVVEPEVEQVVAALEPEPQAVAERAEGADETSATKPALEEELEEEQSEWARIDAALDSQEEAGGLAVDILPEEDAAEMRFELAGVIIDGSSIYSARELLPIYRHYIGSEVSVSDLYSISHAITRRYAADGYSAATAVVPTQSIQSGVATIRIQESFLGEIIVVD
ncbi:MAG: hypothetical protein HOA58_14200, partial [Rhodospirillaceae bacterium]|nr:hypothetical protein [Rhodospirillaceae bacterium]